MVSRGRTTATAGASATRSATTSTAATRTATTKAAPTKAATTTTRKQITQSAAGQAVQAQFKQAVSSAVQSVGIDFGVPTVKTTIQETPTEIITITEKPEVIEEPIIEEPIIEEPFIELPELIPEVFAEEQINLSDDIIQILNDIENGVILVPTWFRNNIEWVKNGHITQQEFRTAYNYLVDTQVVHPAKTGIGTDPTITNNMINQHLDYFTIENGRAKGQITFTLNDNFNPSYYNTDLVNIILNTQGVVGIVAFKIINLAGEVYGRDYSEVTFNVGASTDRGIIVPPPGGIFEIKYMDDGKRIINILLSIACETLNYFLIYYIKWEVNHSLIR